MAKSGETSDQERITALENQVKLLWETILGCPRLDGIHDAAWLASQAHQVKPLTFEKDSAPPNARPSSL